MEQQVYLIRYGLMGHVGRFAVEGGSAPFERGERVVVRTARGTELGEILAPSSGAAPSRFRILRAAGADDLRRACSAGGRRPELLSACEGLFGDGVWPIVLVDVEPLLDDRRAVLYYLGPHGLDDAGLREVLADRCGLDAILEPVGRDEPASESNDEPSGGCGSGGCGSGGCGSGSRAARSDSGGGGCGSCSVKELVRSRARRVAMS